MPDADATNKLELGEGDDRPPTAPQPLVPGVEPGHFVPYAQAAALGFLALLGLGAVLLLALKLQSPGLGGGGDPLDVFSSIVIMSLAVLRVPVHVGGLTLTVLPLGALGAAWLLIRWACRTAAPNAPVRRALVVGAFFSVFAWFAALVFRLRLEPDAIFAGSIGALVFGFLWPSLFAASAFSGRPLRVHLRERLEALEAKRPLLFEAIRLAGLMLAGMALLAAGAALVWAIVALARGAGPQELSAGDLVAGLLYVVAFAPNLVLDVLSLSLGAAVDYGAALTLVGRVRGPLRELSMFSDGGMLYLLLLIPLVACGASGHWARRVSQRADDGLKIVVTASFLVATSLALLGSLADVRLGAELASARGFALIAPRAWQVFAFGALWAAAAGYGGWLWGGRRA